jgi:hypothetical protein
MRKIHLLLHVLLTPNKNVVIGQKYGEHCFMGCELSINYVDFNDMGLALRKVEPCQSKLRATSLYLCIDEYCSDQGKEEWLWATNKTCQLIANTSMPPYDIIAEYGPDRRAALRRVSAAEAFAHPLMKEPWLPDGPFFTRAFKTIVWLPA